MADVEKNQAGKIKPFLLSFALFPGLGQLSQGKKILGFSIMAIVIVCTYLVLSAAFSEINLAAQRIIQEGSSDAYRIQQEAHNVVTNLTEGKVILPLYTLIAAWLFSALEVFRDKKS